MQGAADDRYGYFILDTGAPSLILNQKYFNEMSSSGGVEQTAVGLNGGVKRVRMRYADLELDNRKWNNVYAALYDLEYLEEAKGIQILGLIGSLIFRNDELEIDFEKKQLLIYELDRQGEMIDVSARRIPPDVAIPFNQKGHLPCIEAYVEGLPLRLGIDSGAGIALIIHEKHTQLSPFAEPEEIIRIRGLDQNSVQTRTYQLHGLNVSNLSYSRLRIAFTDLSSINDQFAGLDVDGILGLDALSQHRMSINFRKKEIYIWVPPSEDDQLVLQDRKTKETKRKEIMDVQPGRAEFTTNRY